MNKIAFLITFLFLSNNNFAQTLNELKANPDVSWAIEMYTDYYFQYNAPNEQGINKNVILKRHLSNHEELHLHYKSIYYDIYLSAKNPNTKCYWDSELEQAFTAEEKKSLGVYRDTIITFDPETFEEIVQVVASRLDPNEVRSLRLKHLLYYNKKDLMYYSVPQAIAVLVKSYDDNGNFVSNEPMFWLPANAISKVPKLSKSSIIWANRTISDCEITGLTKHKQLIEKSTFPETTDKILHQLNKNESAILVDVKDKPISSKGIHKVLKKIDTLKVPYHQISELKENPEKHHYVDSLIGPKDPTSEDIVIALVATEFDPKNIHKMRLLYNWVWDEKKNTMSLHYMGCGPIMTHEIKGNTVNTVLFYRRVSHLFKK